MGVILASARLYFWPLILANVLASAIVVDHQLYDAICLSLSLSFLSSFGLLINDLWDRHIDRINGIDRFASAGLLVVPSAVAVAMMSLLLGLYSA